MKMTVGNMLLIAIGSSVVVSIIQDGLKYFFMRSRCTSNCLCIKMEFNKSFVKSQRPKIDKKEEDIEIIEKYEQSQ